MIRGDFEGNPQHTIDTVLFPIHTLNGREGVLWVFEGGSQVHSRFGVRVPWSYS